MKELKTQFGNHCSYSEEYISKSTLKEWLSMSEEELEGIFFHTMGDKKVQIREDELNIQGAKAILQYKLNQLK